jgi:3-hydroxymyristoyl/3-hydroxydecanoyl-(acyl carrier protein) dehydratase
MNDIVTHSSVPGDHPSLPGHFPGRPIVPGVVLLDLVFDAIRTWSESRDGIAQPIALLSIVSTKFLQAVAPETRLDMHIKLMAEAPPGETQTRQLKARFTVSHANVSVLEGSFMLAVAERVS